ncbi:hypothetical protein AB837_00280 [bacterium AB1]|nr:hypothetical protein AB837_00280 [bacterium AB1]
MVFKIDKIFEHLKKFFKNICLYFDKNNKLALFTIIGVPEIKNQDNKKLVNKKNIIVDVNQQNSNLSILEKDKNQFNIKFNQNKKNKLQNLIIDNNDNSIKNNFVQKIIYTFTQYIYKYIQNIINKQKIIIKNILLKYTSFII